MEGGTRSFSKTPVVVVVLDTLRADMVDRPDLLASMPFLRGLVDESYFFTRAYAPANTTLPSHASMFTGLLPHQHQARFPRMRIREDVLTIAEVYRREGYRTICITCNPYLSWKYGTTRGFDAVWRWPHRLRWLVLLVVDSLLRRTQHGPLLFQRAANLIDTLAGLFLTGPRMDNGGRRAAQQVRRFLRDTTRAPFVFVNLMEAHEPYYGRGPFASWRKRLQHAKILHRLSELKMAMGAGRLEPTEALKEDLARIYWENARYLDAQLAAVLEGFPQDVLRKGFLIITSDHGQLLGEKNLLGHMAGLYEDLIRVPLLIRPPRGNGREVLRDPFNITWLFDLLRRIASGEEDGWKAWLSGARKGQVVISEAHGGIVPHPEFLLVARDPQFVSDWIRFKTRHDHPAVACVSGRWKLICHLGRREDEVFDVVAEPKETVNLVSEEKDVMEGLHAELRKQLLGGGSATAGIVRKERLPLRVKKAISDAVLTATLEDYENPVLVWTGGKDSNLALHLTLDVARGRQLPVPTLLFVDHGQHFPETWSFMEEVTEKEGLEVIVARNENLLAAAEGDAQAVPVESLDSENQQEAFRAGLEGTEVSLSLDTPVGNHLLKTVALNQYLRDHGIDAVISGIRWDENPARSSEVFFSPREEPPHIRIHPILPWSEGEVWDHTLEQALPIHPLYRRGYRSFDGVRDSAPTDTRPAWEQDLEAIEERAGRAQDKEEIMEQLRALGYF